MARGVERPAAQHIHVAPVGAEPAATDGERGGLARAVGADEAEDRATRHGEVEPVKRPDAAIAFAHRAEGQREFAFGSGVHKSLLR